MPDYIPEADAETKITSAIQKCLDGVAGARTSNQLILNPRLIVLDFVILFTGGENAVSTESTQTPEITTETTTETPGVVTEVGSESDSGRSDTETTTPGSKTTVTGRVGADVSLTKRTYEEFED